MVLAHLSPPWFFGIDVVLEVLFAIVTFLVAIFARKIYKNTGQRPVKYLSISFFLISLSYMIQSIFNFLIVSRLNDAVCTLVKIRSIATFETLAILTHIFFMTIGRSILLYTTLKDKRLRTLWLLIAVALVPILLSPNIVQMFYAITSLYLIFISWHFILNYLKNKHPRTLSIAAAFVFLLFGSFHFLISVDHEFFYAVGHILELFAYLLILINLYLVRR